MNGSQQHNSNDPGRPIPLPSAMPPELVETSRLMDALGECDRASAPAGLEGRLMSSLASILPPASAQAGADVADATRRVEALAQADQAAASRTLEDRIFMATRGVLTANAVKIGMPVQVRTKSVGWLSSASFATRAAAGLLLGGGVIWGYMALKPANPNSSPILDSSKITVAKLEKEIDKHMDELGDIFALAMISTTADVASTPSDDTTESDSWFQYDFLQAGDSL